MKFKSWVIFRATFFFRFVTLGVSLIFLSILSIKILDSNFIASIFLILTAALLIFGNYLFKRFYYKRAIIEVSDSGFRFSIFSKSMNESNFDISLNELVWYSVEVINPKFYSINFQIGSEKKINYSLPQSKVRTSDNEASEIIDTINSRIALYNKSIINESDKILLRPAFFATTRGLYTIISFSILALIVFILNILFIPKASFFGIFMATFAIFQMIIKRRNNLSFFNKMEIAHQL